MTDLLEFAIERHGGLARWRQLTKLSANMSITGAIWPAKDQADALANVRVEVRLHSQHVVIPPSFPSARKLDLHAPEGLRWRRSPVN